MRLILLFALLCLTSGCARKPAPQSAPPDVLVTEVKQEDVPIVDDFVSTLDGSVNASIQARVQGYLTSQDYKEGTEVKKGDLLFEIDPRPFAAALAQAKAALAQAEAAARQAELVANRNLELFKTKAISEQERDNTVQQALAAKAQVEAQRAAVEQAQLNLDYTSIKSPVDGVAGLAKVQVGDLVGPSTGLLATVSTVDPIKAYFTVSDQRFTAYSARYADPQQRAEHEKTMPAEMGYDYAAMSFQEKKAADGVSPKVVFGMSLLFVFLILAALYESWTLPLSVLLGTPIAVFGAFAALWLRSMENNVYA